MTAARVELRWLVLTLVMLRVGVGRVGGDGMALDRVSRYVRRKALCVGGRHIVLEIWEKSRGGRCGSRVEFALTL